jgi:hypothetical protein
MITISISPFDLIIFSESSTGGCTHDAYAQGRSKTHRFKENLKMRLFFKAMIIF